MAHMDAQLLQSFPEKNIYTGLWINRSFGAVQGATLTLDRRSGGLLIAFFALYIGATGRAFWKLTRFLLHCVFSGDRNPDGIYHQRQAILRNSHLAYDSAIELLGASLSWQKKTNQAYRRTVPAASLAALVGTAFVVAGVLFLAIST